ncbi:MAG TPA: biotin carboxylase N-terminal domain-containing protein [Actinocrinis sp.]|nr:biotin carboxylase N-terminal domain-containing protein [Actinocrinis sp.]
MTVFEKVLVANRGEIAVRVLRTLRELGIAGVAVYSDPDAAARHVREADEAVRIGPAAAAHSYLDIGAIVDAARRTGAQAVHPGYGFLSENAAFAAACRDAGLVFIGPPAEAIAMMGDKIRAKATVAAAGVPVVPGIGEPGMSDADLAAAMAGIGFPVLIKPSAGGGGKGMRVVRRAEDAAEAVAGARREARAAFGDDTLLAERYIQNPRHIEIQVLADTHGTVVHLGERECSLQRRHQKIIEEAPSPLLAEQTRAAMGDAAAEAARSVGYTGAGTVEFIVSGDRPEEFHFMEMNTRLQVEHAVTELVTGLDLVEWQVRVAAGERLPFYSGPAANGHAIEARVYAEDPGRGFLPTGGAVLALREPHGRPGVRVDSGLAEGTVVGSDYDPMLSKVVAWGRDRGEALRRLDAALADTVILGVTTNVAYLRDLLADEDVRAGRLDTGLVERRPVPAADTPDEVFAAAALAQLLALTPAPESTDLWAAADGWRPGGHAWTRFYFTPGTGAGAPVEVRVQGGADRALVAVGDGEPVAAGATRDRGGLTVDYGGRRLRFAHAADSLGPLWFGRGGRTWALTPARPPSTRAAAEGPGDGTVRSPMPGTVTAVHVAAGESVRAGQTVLVVEAMKMEHAVAAPLDGVVTDLTAIVGRQVRMDEPLAAIRPEELKTDA